MADFTDKPGYAFNPGPPPEVASFFRNKGLRPSFSFEDVEPEEHAVGFSAAKAMHLDVLEALQGALQQAIDEGIPYEQFARELKPRLKKLGWWGVKELVDPLTGDARKVQLGRSWDASTSHNTGPNSHTRPRRPAKAYGRSHPSRGRRLFEAIRA